MGFSHFGHFDTWTIDSIQNIVGSNHSVLLFPHGSNTIDYKSIPESMGTVVLYDYALKYVINAIEISPLSQYKADMKFLCESMETKVTI